MNEKTRRGRVGFVVASALALIVAVNAGVGTPSSEFAPKDTAWWTLEPVMWPSLVGGVVLGLVASLSTLRDCRRRWDV